MALHEHLAPYLGEQNAAALTETLLRLRGWAIWCLNELGDSFAQAIEYGQGLVADAERVLGDTHPRHPDIPQQPRLRLPGSRATGGGHPAVRADPRRPGAGPGPGRP